MLNEIGKMFTGPWGFWFIIFGIGFIVLAVDGCSM